MDTGIVEGSTISMFYDPMISKVMCTRAYALLVYTCTCICVHSSDGKITCVMYVYPQDYHCREYMYVPTICMSLHMYNTLILITACKLKTRWYRRTVHVHNVRHIHAHCMYCLHPLPGFDYSAALVA